jgi:uncharacterized SAM-binding protein YcdF (DUF218 family)
MRVKHAIVCLGQLLHPNGTMPESLCSRVVTAINAHKAINDKTLLLFTGGDVRKANRTEARAMLDYAHGNLLYNSTDVLLEEAATSTVMNALNCKELLDTSDDLNITLVTSDYHIPRAKLIFRCCFGARATICAIGAPTMDAASRRRLVLQELSFFPNLTDYLKDYYNPNSSEDHKSLEHLPTIWEVELAKDELKSLLKIP